jgi:hypothetical protein
MKARADAGVGGGGAEVYFHTFLPSALDKDAWSPSYSSRFTARKTATGKNWTGERENTRDTLNVLKKKMNMLPCQVSKTWHVTLQLITP